ncbi:Matrix metalloproteinase-20 [Trichinella murrelli]|uniref:Matrix metalloproteinase-20 n=1 Tax=Trichinella murrelli TaxID=144512 RepID=A0A0V0TCJ4_9BILA|nr:Matrix metalloproteinase-20 [Trichinella murrelli]
MLQQDCRLLWLFFCISFVVHALGAPIISSEQLHQKYNVDYLFKYKYLNKMPTINDIEQIISGLKKFQEDVGLPVTGEMTKQTRDLMDRPRCGMTDTNDKSRRTKRFVPHHSKWRKRTLIWRLDDPYELLTDYDRFVVRTTLHRAFNEWSEASQKALKFKENENSTGLAHINIFFAHGDHNDSLPFDGMAGVVAHGFYPTNGNLHFDAAEHWTLHMDNGINLFQTAVHEIGHLLGLEHSTDYNAVMFPINRPYDPMFRLGDDDIRGIRYLYAPWAWTACNILIDTWEKCGIERI